MLTKYFKFKTNTHKFKDDSIRIIKELANKKILLFTNKNEFLYLDNIYNFSKNLNIVGAILPISKQKINKKDFPFPLVEKEDIKNIKFDEILVLDSDADKITNQIKYHLFPDTENIKTPFIEYVKEEKCNLNYLLKYNFDKTLPKLLKKLKNKTVIVYGAGVFFQLIKEYFDISELNTIGIVDKKFNDTSSNCHLYGYALYKTDDIPKLKPDYVLIATKIYLPIWEGLYFNFLEKTNIKILPIVRKNLFSILNDIIKN